MQKPKGTIDVYGTLGDKIIQIENLFQYLMKTYNYEYVRTPIFELSSLYHRSVGESSDIVRKETYDFKDRGNRDITLRPEGTAGVVRSYIENKMYTALITKTWYYGPMYRYERPQAGRMREFYQIGVETFGVDSSYIDAEVISIPVTFCKLLGLNNIKVNINSLGDSESKKRYREALVKHFSSGIKDMCPDCQSRYETNPLRILDCKVDHDHPLMKTVPNILDYLSDESNERFEELQQILSGMGIDFEVNPKLVRGLDYYTDIVFEIELISGSVICGGGRYNNLVEELGGPSTPAVGFAFGLERLILALDQENVNILTDTGLDAYIIPIGDYKKEAIELMTLIRNNGFKVDMAYASDNIKTNFKQADRYNSKYIILLGEEEIKEGYYTIKNNKTKEEEQVDSVYIINYLDEKIEAEDYNEEWIN
jgi:histidyl-tRNA synthetase